jgi:hypothetical protein
MQHAAPDLSLGDCAARWALSRNAIKARAAFLGVPLRRESSTRTVWPSQFVALGDELHQHLQRPKATLASYGGPRLEATGAAPLAAPVARPVPAAGAGSGEALAAMLAALRPAAVADPLAVVEALARAADLAAWLTTAELAAVAGVSPGTVGGWPDGHRPRPGVLLRRRKDRGRVWWRVERAGDRWHRLVPPMGDDGRPAVRQHPGP